MILTIVTAALLSLLLVALSIWVVDGRRRAGVAVGDGGNPMLMARMRAQANLVEYAPVTLILLFLAEQSLEAGWFLPAMAGLFLVARIAHPLGMVRPAPNALRILGMVGTWVPMVALSLALMLRLAVP